MPTTRSSARRTDGSSPAPSTSTTGSKRKATDASPSSAPKKGRRGAPKKQKTIEDTMPKPKDTGMLTDEDEAEAEAEETEVAAPQDPVNGESKEVKPPKEDLSKENADGLGDKETVGESSSKPEASKEETQSEDVEPKKPATEGNAVEKSAEREESTPSSILEKGIIYFFFRGRVGIDEPSAVDEIARSYIVLRPIPHGAKIGDGPMGDDGNARVLALPKKVLPVSPNDRFMVFVNKARSTIEDIKKDFLSASDYETKTAGTRHTPPATPIGEGIYAITTTGKESHLAYILTLPTEISEVQKDIGLQERGSFVTSVKNPQYESPANAQLPDGPKFPQEYVRTQNSCEIN